MQENLRALDEQRAAVENQFQQGVRGIDFTQLDHQEKIDQLTKYRATALKSLDALKEELMRGTREVDSSPLLCEQHVRLEVGACRL